MRARTRTFREEPVGARKGSRARRPRGSDAGARGTARAHAVATASRRSRRRSRALVAVGPEVHRGRAVAPRVHGGRTGRRLGCVRRRRRATRAAVFRVAGFPRRSTRATRRRQRTRSRAPAPGSSASVSYVPPREPSFVARRGRCASRRAATRGRGEAGGSGRRGRVRGRVGSEDDGGVRRGNVVGSRRRRPIAHRRAAACLLARRALPAAVSSRTAVSDRGSSRLRPPPWPWPPAGLCACPSAPSASSSAATGTSSARASRRRAQRRRAPTPSSEDQEMGTRAFLPSRSAGRHSGRHVTVLQAHARAHGGAPRGRGNNVGAVRRARHAAREARGTIGTLAPSRRGLRLAASVESALAAALAFAACCLLQALDVVSQLLQPPAAPSGVPAGDAVERRGRRHAPWSLAAERGALLAQRQARRRRRSAPSSALSGTAAIAAPGAFLPPIPAGVSRPRELDRRTRALRRPRPA